MQHSPLSCNQGCSVIQYDAKQCCVFSSNRQSMHAQSLSVVRVLKHTINVLCHDVCMHVHGSLLHCCDSEYGCLWYKYYGDSESARIGKAMLKCNNSGTVHALRQRLSRFNAVAAKCKMPWGGGWGGGGEGGGALVEDRPLRTTYRNFLCAICT